MSVVCRVSLALMLWSGCVLPVAGQFASGDLLVLTDQGAVLRVSGSNVSTVASTLGFVPIALVQSTDNRAVWVTTGRATVGEIHELSPQGTTQLIVQGGGHYPVGVADDGKVLLRSRYWPLAVFFGIDPWKFVHVESTPMIDAYLCGSDPTTGGIICQNNLPNQAVVRVDRRRATFSTLRTGGVFGVGIGSVLCYSPEIDSVVGGGDPSGGLVALHLAPPHARTTLARVGGISAWTRLSLSGNYVVGDGNNRVLQEIDPATGATVRVIARNVEAWSILEVGHRKLVGTQAVVNPGTRLQLRLAFTAHPGADYVTAMSLSVSQGTPVGNGHTIHIAPDGLFRWSLTNAPPFQSFQGNLNANGDANPFVWLPRLPALAGHRLFAAAVVIRSGRVVDVAGPVGVTIQ